MVKIQYIETTKLIPLANNPRTIQPEKMEQLERSIIDNPDFFEVRPIICSNRTGKLVIIAENQRHAAALKLGIEKVPVAILELTEQKEKEISLRDNINQGEWDLDILREWDIDFEDFGFDFELTQDVKFKPKKQVLTDFNRSHVLISYHPSMHLSVQSVISKLSEIPGIEIERGSN